MSEEHEEEPQPTEQATETSSSSAAAAAAAAVSSSSSSPRQKKAAVVVHPKATTSRALPGRSKSAAVERSPTRGSTAASAGRNLPARSKSSADGDDRGRRTASSRKKKSGIRVAITVQKREEDDDEEEQDADKSNDENDADVRIYQMDVHSSGKFSKKGAWDDVNSFWQHNQSSSVEINPNSMCDLLEQYSQEQYPERRNADNLKPKRCYLRDEPLRGIRFYKDYEWDPVKLTLRTDRTATNGNGPIEILERWTRRITLERIPVDFSTDLESILIEQGDKAVTSTLKKSPLQGHPLALSMMSSDTQIVTALRGLESVVFVFGNGDEKPDDVDKETGVQIWRDVKTLRALLHDKVMPQREGKGQQRVVEVVGLESFLKFRVHYAASFEGDVVSDHGVGLLLGERWWAHPLKDIMMGFGVENKAKIYEDMELHFYSEIGYKMENEYFDWENHGGKWIKVKKQRQPA